VQEQLADMFADCASYGERVTSLRTVLQHVGARVEVRVPYLGLYLAPI
jgi:hypothetical protein